MNRDALIQKISDLAYPKLHDAWDRIFSDLYVEADELAAAVVDAIEPEIRGHEAFEAGANWAHERLSDYRDDPEDCPVCYEANDACLYHQGVIASRWQKPSEVQVEAVTDALEPHWRTDCSDSPIGGPYVRWVKCRCGWESPKSETEVHIPDLHRIWNGHVARAALLAAKEAE